jgi:hypothetical protein
LAGIDALKARSDGIFWSALREKTVENGAKTASYLATAASSPRRQRWSKIEWNRRT